MPEPQTASIVTDSFRRSVLLVIIAVALVGTLGGWYIMGARGQLAPALRLVQATSCVALLALFAALWLKLLPQRVLELSCLVFAAGISMACMALRMYVPLYGASIDLEPLYLWVPVIYVFAFMLTDHRTGLLVSLCIFGLFLLASSPYLVLHLDGRYANFTVQLHVVSAAMIATLYFFSSYQHRLRLAQAAMHQLSHLSYTDELTQLPNRRHMATVIEQELAALAHGDHGFALVLFDIDRFKAINDGGGHAAGDVVLTRVARRAGELLGGSGSLARWGGDEFLALVRGSGADAMRAAHAVCAGIAAAPLAVGGVVTISCGVAVAQVGDNIDSLLQRADAGLYAAKRGGRNRVEKLEKPGSESSFCSVQCV